MATLEKHLLLYDKDCPLCANYTKFFVRYHFLSAESRLSFQDMNFENTTIDEDLARNKIALYDTETKETLYGIDAIGKVIGNKYNIVNTLLKIKPIYWILTQLYNFISFNRKIFIPVSCKNLTSCNPSKNWFWRSFLILMSIILFQSIYPNYLEKYFEGNYINDFYFTETLLFLVLIIYQGTFCSILKERNAYDYLGHLCMIVAMNALFIYVFSLILKLLELTGVFTQLLGVMGVGIALAWSIIEHNRRMKLLEMNNWLTVSFVGFLILIYPFLFSM